MICAFRKKSHPRIISSLRFWVHRHAAWLAASIAVFAISAVVPATATVVRIQILQTTDLHGYVDHSDELEHGGGMLRLATAIKRRRRIFGRNRTILIDCGDTVQGTWEAAYSRGQVGIEYLRELDYDVWVPGNHELDFGTARLLDFCRQTRGFVTAANLAIQNDHDTYSTPPWRLFRRGSARIAVSGMTSAAMDLWFWGEQYKGYQADPTEQILEQILPRVLVMKPDMIILAAHQGWLPGESRGINDIKQIAEHYPQLDLILGGHTHWEHAGKEIGPRTWYVQAGRHADMLGVIFAEIDTDKNKVLDITSRLLTIEEDRFTPDKAMRDTLTSHWLGAANQAGAKTIGMTESGISADGRLGVDCPKFELLCRAIAEATQVDAVIHSRLTRFDLKAGPVTRREVYMMVPYENGIGVAELTAAQIITIMEEQQSKRNSYVACGLWGLDIQRDETGKPRGLLTSDGQQVPASAKFRVAFNSYTLASGGGRFPTLRKITRQPSANLRDTGLMTRAVVEAYFRKHSPVNVNELMK